MPSDDNKAITHFCQFHTAVLPQCRCIADGIMDLCFLSGRCKDRRHFIEQLAANRRLADDKQVVRM